MTETLPTVPRGERRVPTTPRWDSLKEWAGADPAKAAALAALDVARPATTCTVTVELDDVAGVRWSKSGGTLTEVT